MHQFLLYSCACNNGKTPEEDNNLTIGYVFNASKQQVFNAWANIRQLAYWYFPDGCTLEIYEHDFREKGIFLYSIFNPVAITQHISRGVYREIIPEEKIIYSLTFADFKGNPVDPLFAGLPEWPAETIITVKFCEWKGQTYLSLHQTISEKLAQRIGLRTTWLNMFRHLEKHLSALPAL